MPPRPGLCGKKRGAIASGIDEPEIVRYDDATHWLHAEHPDRFVADVREFIEQE